MNETMEEIMEEVQVENHEDLFEGSASVSDSVSVSVSSGNAVEGFENVPSSAGSVSSGDAVSSLLENQGMVQAMVLHDADAAQALSDAVGSLDFKVSCILFLLLFIWCEKKIRAAVLKMTGRREQL